MPNTQNTSIQPLFIQRHVENQAEVRSELQQGLLETKATTSPKYLYDALGSRLFEAITELPEYYPTRVEASIFEQFSHEPQREERPQRRPGDPVRGAPAKHALRHRQIDRSAGDARLAPCALGLSR